MCGFDGDDTSGLSVLVLQYVLVVDTTGLVVVSDRHRRSDCGMDTSRDVEKGLLTQIFLLVSFVVQDTLLVVIFVLLVHFLPCFV